MNQRTMKHRTLRLAAVSGAAVAGLLALGVVPASAHVGTSVDEVPAGGRTALGLTIGHGCDDSPTTVVAVQVPEGVNEAQAFAKPGWTVATETEELDPPIESGHGEEITERVATITFSAEAGNELPSDLRDTFTVNFTAPETEGELLFFKTIQTCEVGENRWIEEFDGEGEEPESPAPVVTVVAAEEEGGHGEAEEATTETTEAGAHDEADESAASESTSSEDSDGGSDGLAIAALVVGALGLITGGVALTRTRRAPTA